MYNRRRNCAVPAFRHGRVYHSDIVCDSYKQAMNKSKFITAILSIIAAGMALFLLLGTGAFIHCLQSFYTD